MRVIKKALLLGAVVIQATLLCIQAFAATISGTVTLPNGQPLVQSTILLMFDKGLCYDSFYQTTDNSGNFTFSNLANGTYGLNIMPNVQISNQAYAVQNFYDKKKTSCEANLITVTGTQSVNISTSVEIGGKISGSVVDACGKPLGNSFVSCVTSSSPMNYMSGTVGVDGTYKTAIGAPGTYICSVFYNMQSYYYNGVTEYAKATPITVSAGVTQQNINFRLPMCVTSGNYKPVVIPLCTSTCP